jgi:Ca-activated chloride channel family protein
MPHVHPQAFTPAPSPSPHPSADGRCKSLVLRTMLVWLALCAWPKAAALAWPLTPQSPPAPSSLQPHAARWVVPQLGRAAGTEAIRVTDVAARVSISGNVATTTLEVGVANHSSRPEQATLLVPVPGNATVTGFTFQGPASESTAQFLPRADARTLYDSIVARERDPALLEWAGWNLLRSSVFPVPANGGQRVQIVWEELLVSSSGRMDYVLPRSDIHGSTRWNIDVAIDGPDVAAVYSPSHEVTVTRGSHVHAAPKSGGAFRLCIVRGTTPQASVLTYPDPASGGGFFLMLLGAPADEDREHLRREVTLVLDRSGSMAGAPFERSKAAAIQILDGLDARDTANVIDFANGVSRYATAPTALTPEARAQLRAYIAALRPSGGTNMHDALVEALRQPAPAPGTLPAVLFITDGVPTVGQTQEANIRVLAEKGNAAGRRVFTIGLGNDIAVPLLDRISDVTRATSTYLGVGDNDLTARLTEVAERLRGPVLADAHLEALGATGAPAPGRVEEVLPLRLPDLFRGGSLVVLGRYRGEDPFTLSVGGTGAKGPLNVSVNVDPRNASTANAFVPRLWASRRIAVLVDEIRQQGLVVAGSAGGNHNDPRWRELAGEIVRLSTTYGILTEYTSMLALEGSSFHDLRALETACLHALNGRAVDTRTGSAAVSQGRNWNRQKLQMNQAETGNFLAPNGSQVDALAMNQCGDKTLYRVGNAWADASLVGRSLEVQEEIAYGSARHKEVLWQLVDEGRQSALAFEGDIVLQHKGRTIRIRNGNIGPMVEPGC